MSGDTEIVISLCVALILNLCRKKIDTWMYI